MPGGRKLISCPTEAEGVNILSVEAKAKAEKTKVKGMMCVYLFLPLLPLQLNIRRITRCRSLSMQLSHPLSSLFQETLFMSMWVIVTKTGDVTAWQVTAGEPQTPRPESLTYDNGYRADDLWVRTAIPYDSSYRIIRQQLSLSNPSIVSTLHTYMNLQEGIRIIFNQHSPLMRRTCCPSYILGFKMKTLHKSCVLDPSERLR